MQSVLIPLLPANATTSMIDQATSSTTSASPKIIPWQNAAEHCALLRREGRRVVQCHGTFDMIHPGHIIHFEEAKSLGDYLVVTITGEKFVNKGPGRPYFNDQIRSRWLAALSCVDCVVVVPHAAAEEAIDWIRPDVYCKGREYENQANDVTGNIKGDLAAAARAGAAVHYVGSVVYSSTELINKHFDPYPAEVRNFCEIVARQCSAKRFRAMVDSLSNIKVLVVGDIIFDRYTTVEVQGLTSKNRILSGRFVADELQAGGALAVLRHLRQFTSNVKLFSQVGTEPWLEAELAKYLRPEEDALTRSEKLTTIVKQRFVEPRVDGKELSKLFSVNYIDKLPPSKRFQGQMLDKLASQVRDYDLVLVMDFGHGLLGDSLRDLIQSDARFMSLNCQTNSNNQGFNIINRRYQRADAFTLDQTEMSLAVGQRNYDFGDELKKMSRGFGSRYGWLTRGAIETIGCSEGSTTCRCTPMESGVVDSIGAGDAFCSIVSLAAVAGMPLELSTFLGQLAGAQAIKIVGNAESINKARLIKSGTAMLTL